MADQEKGTPGNAGEQAKDAAGNQGAGDPVCNSSGIPLKRFYTEQDTFLERAVILQYRINNIFVRFSANIFHFAPVFIRISYY